jgi:nucleotide-binding universal stress UspA family protein
VVPLFFGRGGPSVEPWDDQAIHEAQLAEAGEILAQSGIEPDLIRVSGDPAAIIEAVAERDGYDTVVVGGERKGLPARILTGNVAIRLAERSLVTVVIARQGTQAPGQPAPRRVAARRSGPGRRGRRSLPIRRS